jgi:hypothetical protein
MIRTPQIEDEYLGGSLESQNDSNACDVGSARVDGRTSARRTGKSGH